MQCSAQCSANIITLVERTKKLGKAFEKIEKILRNGPYFKGDSFSNVDLAWLPLLHRASVIEKYTGYDFLEKYPKVKLWQLSILKTGLAEKSVTEDFEDAFIHFYLSDKTYLGSGKNSSTSDESTQCSSSHCG
jgi:glutathione S-transferase